MNPTKRIFLLLFSALGLLGARPATAQGTAANKAKAPAKSVGGIWRGYFITESGDQYKLEFQIDKATGAVKGVSYSYLDTRFYGKSSMKGVFNSATNTFTIEELRTVEVRNMGGGGTCLMNYKLDFTQSGKELFLEGTYLGKREDRANPKNNGTWGDCGGGRVFLRRVETSDFYEEPFLKKRDTVARVPARKTTPPATPPTARRTTPPVKTPATGTTARRTPPAKTTTPAPRATTPPVVKTVPRRTETLPPVKSTLPATSDKPPVAKRVDPIAVPVQTRNRENTTLKVFDVNHEEVLVKLYDNGEVDGDTISVYFDNKLVLSKKGLSASPLELRLSIDPSNPEHTLVMVAENLGRIPPNTALMVVWDGDKRYEAQITSTESKNAMVRFRYAPTPQSP